MFFLPYALGVVFSNPTILHIPFLIGWFFLYLSATPWLNQLRNANLRKQMLPWAITYTAIGLLFAVPITVVYVELFWFALIILPLFVVNIFFVLRKQERHLLNDLSGIAILSLGAPAAFVIGSGDPISNGLLLWGIVIVYFFGTAFYVKSLIRERTNTSFHKKSHLYHGLILLLPWLIGTPKFALALLPSALKDWFTPRKRALRPLVIGITEISSAILFFILTLIFPPI